ncbi:hypothetical protein EVAR_28718_1 [Eumeta japonica]|uniref:Uncharacterized protein n=1 Tax=Eumeta variegata TaxID=151549 RepID=A0A4C1V421_EUMVA|nr:hypothetical protein EVAR_28718_1 [Eumeta japonica]
MPMVFWGVHRTRGPGPVPRTQGVFLFFFEFMGYQNTIPSRTLLTLRPALSVRRGPTVIYNVIKIGARDPSKYTPATGEESNSRRNGVNDFTPTLSADGGR